MLHSPNGADEGRNRRNGRNFAGLFGRTEEGLLGRCEASCLDVARLSPFFMCLNLLYL